MTLLTNGDKFPSLVVNATTGGTVRLPEAFANAYGIVLFYRGAWCPLCREQLQEYATASQAFTDLGVKIVALSVDDEATTQDFVNKHRLPYTVGHSVDAATIAALTGAFTNAQPFYLHPTNYILAPNGTILSALYSSSAVGRLSAADAKRFITFVRSKAKAA